MLLGGRESDDELLGENSEDLTGWASDASGETRARATLCQKVLAGMEGCSRPWYSTGPDGVSRVKSVLLLGERLEIDDHDTSMVLVFTRLKEYDANEVVEEPWDKAKKIFVRSHNDLSERTMKSGFEELAANEPVPMLVYQHVVRRQLINLLDKSGFKVAVSRSIDDDEVFVKLRLDPDGEVIKQLARSYGYPMPFTEGAYKRAKPIPKPMKDSEGVQVMARARYAQERAVNMENFRHVDEIRLIERRLAKWVGLAELCDQKVITKFFCAAQHERVLDLCHKWANLRRIRNVPNYKIANDLRDYFGEEIAFFFVWFVFYTRMLIPLACVGASVQFVMSLFSVPIFFERVLQLGFGGVMVVWASVFHKLFKQRVERLKHRWGMHDFLVWDNIAPELAGYDPESEGSWKQACLYQLTNAAVLVYLFIFSLVLVWLEVLSSGSTSNSSSSSSYYVTSVSRVVLIKGTSFFWAKIVGFLVGLQNHRTHQSRTQALTWNLAVVKIFITLYPFVQLAFVKPYQYELCDTSLIAAAERIWPEHLFGNHTVWPPAALRELGEHWSSLEGNGTRTCIYKCHPERPPKSFPMTNDETNCLNELEQTLTTFFLFHCLFLTVFIIYPVLTTRWHVYQEKQKSDKTTPYTFLQYQAKSHDEAPYEFDSWGGSLVDDMLELAAGFALLTSFGQLVPGIAFIAFLFNLIEYRLFAFRMACVTCRPFPRGADGVGRWQNILEAISVMAVIINVLLAVIVMYPLRTKTDLWKLAFFLLFEHALLFGREVLRFFLPDVPPDVHRIVVFNDRFKMEFIQNEQLSVPDAHKESFVQSGITELLLSES